MPNLPDVKEGRYCQLFGSVRNQDGRKIIMVLKMCQVDNINIVTTHLLQVIHTRLEAEAMNKEGVRIWRTIRLLTYSTGQDKQTTTYFCISVYRD